MIYIFLSLDFQWSIYKSNFDLAKWLKFFGLFCF